MCRTLPRPVLLRCCYPLNTNGVPAPASGAISSLAGEPAELLALSVAYAVVAYRGREYVVPRNAVQERTMTGVVPVQG